MTATNAAKGAIVTLGTDSIGLGGQSVGGGGGRAGKAGATAGGADDDLEQVLYDNVAGGLGVPDSTTNVVDKIFVDKDYVNGDFAELDKITSRLTGSAKDPKKSPTFSPEIDLGVAVGGNGGAAGNGGAINLENDGQIGTQGAHADGVYGLSVGGGGGIAGASAASGASSDDTRFDLAVSLGGAGGAAGNGGTVSVSNPGHVETSASTPTALRPNRSAAAADAGRLPPTRTPRRSASLSASAAAAARRGTVAQST